MKWVPDKTERLELRPHYDPSEIDEICDQHISKFIKKRYGHLKLPIPTDAIEVLIEQETFDYDPFAALATDIEGMTKFHRNSKPSVLISSHLSQHPRYENRRRTTLTHELGHVMLHANLWTNTDAEISCNRDDIDGNTPTYDWMEWQAYYASGAYLMPVTQVQLLVNQIFELGYSSLPFYVNSSAGRGLIVRSKKQFKVSSDAVRVRLKQLGFVTDRKEDAAVLI